MAEEPKKKRGNPNMVKGNTMGVKPWEKGQSGNPNGRPKNPEIDELRKALKEATTRNNQSLLASIVERAYRSDTLAVAILKKLMPDMTKQEIEAVGEINIIITNYKDAGKDKADKQI